MSRTLNMTSQTARDVVPEPLDVQFRCCICLDTFTDPVSIPCGHNFCLECIDSYWDTKDKSECPLCKETFRKRPVLRINRGLASIIDVIKRSLPPQEDDADVVEPPRSRTQLSAGDVPCDVCHGHKSMSVKSCLVCQASYCELHITPHLRSQALQRHRLTDPATFTHSHLCRNHNKPLTKFCKRDLMPVCDECTERDHKHHKVIVMERTSRKIKSYLKDTKVDIQQMIQARLRKVEQIKNSVYLSKKTTQREIQSATKVCAMLITAIEAHQAQMVGELGQRQEEAERRAEALVDELEHEINELQTRNSELQHLELIHNPLHLLQSFPSVSRLPPTREWSEVVVHSDNCMGTVSSTFSKLVDVCQELANKVSAEEAHKINQYAVDITLDPETASGWLVVSPDKKKVSSQTKRDLLPDNPLRFDSCVCILGKENFKSGRRYWEIEVGDKTDWDVGVAKESINRRGSITVRPDTGFWAICRRKGGSLSACTSPSINLHLQEAPQKVGVFLDYEEGLVSFYDAETKTLIYSYSGCSFAEPIYPYFNPCVQDNGKNSAPLIICPLQGREGQDVIVESDV